MGHATRCIPIIKALISANFEPVLASDGDALLLLQKEFPFLKSYTLPSYNIKYTKISKYLKLKLLLSVPSIISAVKKERKVIAQLIEKKYIIGIISDNRFGVYSTEIPSVYLTHQLNVLSGITTFFTSKIHQSIIQKFDECWIPDSFSEENLSGELGHLKNNNFNLKYIGILSRFNAENIEKKYDLLVLLSGVEPQRTLLENKLLTELKNYNGNVIFVRGKLSNASKLNASKNIKVINYLLSDELETIINESELVVARSGYSTIMDLAVLSKKAFFIPTTGQNEQEYLAKFLQKKNITPFCNQEDFRLEKLKVIESYKGFSNYKIEIDLTLFKLFERK